MSASRLFLRPWKVVEIPGGFRVQDAYSRALAYVYFHPESDGREDEFLTYLEALGLADQIARSPDRSTAGLADSDQNPTVPGIDAGLARDKGEN
jgi:hypothetical protein